MTTIAEIQQAVSTYFAIPMIEMKSARRGRDAAHARQIGMYLARELTAHSLPMIGREFGKRDHTTVIYGIRAVEGRMQRAGFRRNIEMLRAKLAPESVEAA